ncbi:TetR/AcrR family transcriptional regulator [Streptomyces flaveolus]|uniref:TetR/AcrR family transcriptional regulator n=1 Tax=Streptomyces flaveolus TaxID=67297 RepID=UPI00343D90D1
MARISLADRRRDLIAAAIEVIATYGIDGATTRRITDQAKANVAMVHYCYDSKEALFSDVFAHAAKTYGDIVKQSDPHSTLAESARQILRGLMTYYLDSPNFAAAAFELMRWARRQHEDRGMAVFDEAVASTRTALQEAAAEDPVDPDTLDEMVYVLGTLADGFAVNWLTYGDRVRAEAQMELTLSVFDTWLAVRRVPRRAGS